MRSTIVSPLLRNSFRRYASTTTQSAASSASATANATTAKAAEVGKKAGETLQQIGKKVGPMATSAFSALGRMGGRTGALVKKIEGWWITLTFIFVFFILFKKLCNAIEVVGCLGNEGENSFWAGGE